MYFVLDYDERRGELLQLTPFEHMAEASQERLRLAQGNQDGRRSIFILVGESQDALTRTHTRYSRRYPERISRDEVGRLARAASDTLASSSLFAT